MSAFPTSALARSFDAWAPDYDRYRPGYPDALFDEIAARLRHSRWMTPDEFIGLVFTASYVRTRTARVQKRLADHVTELLERHAPGGEPVEVAYVVDCEIARRLDR